MSDLRFDDFSARVATNWDLGYEAGYQAAREDALPVPALDVERLATVLCHREHITGYVWCRRHMNEAEAIAREFAALVSQEEPR